MAELSFSAPKVVVDLTTSAGTNTVKNRLLGPAWDSVKSHWELALVNMGEFLLSAEHTSRDNKATDYGNDEWQWYPKVTIVGTSDTSIDDLLIALDLTYEALKIVILNDLQGNPLNSVGVIHYDTVDGQVDEAF